MRLGKNLLCLFFGIICHYSYAQVTNVTLVGPTTGQGLIMLMKDGVWGTICDDSFDHDDAKGVCRLAYPKGDVAVATVEGVFGNGTGKIFYDELQCTGLETSLENCRSDSFHDCFHSEDAGVICDSKAVKMRLVNGAADGMSGRLEVSLNGQWGTVCDDEFTSKAAKIACKELGLPSMNSYVSTFGQGTGQIWYDDVLCQGSETTLLACNMTEIGNNDCGHSEDVGIVCTDKVPTVNVRLVNGQSPDEGRVEVQVNGQWGTVCDDLWNEVDANVVCSMLGYTNGTARGVGNAYFGSGSGSILMDDVQCVGTEQNIAQCVYGGFGVHDCDHSEDAGVICHSESTSDVKVRLVGGSNSAEGRVEVFHNNRWGTVCDDEFDNREAKVICNMLGFGNGSALAMGNAFFGEGSGTIQMDELACSGRESNIGLCRFDGFGNNDCDHTEDASVICNAGAQNLTVRLVNGKTQNEGRVEVYYHNQWGTVCDDYFGKEEAKTVCRMLGLPTAEAQSVSGGYFGDGIGRIWLDNLHCTGLENSLDSCRHNPFGANNCDHSEDVGVRCGGTMESPVRLVGGVGPFEGRLEVFHDNQWGTVCEDGFGVTDAQVVCNVLGFPSDTPVVQGSSAFGPGTGNVWLSRVQCNGSEPALDLCIHGQWGSSSCSHDKDVGIMCRNHGLECYHCDGLTDPRSCKETQQCAVGEACEEASYIINGETRISMACQSQLVCDALAQGSAVGRRSTRQASGQTTQVKCCTTPLCNKDILTIDNPHTSTGTGPCADKSGTDCSALDGMKICENQQAAKLMCPKHCGICT
uniref:Scavenger receptor cysteine-rich protein n=1 Tax=Azumapecten farreri TaxID=106299 RepID=C7EAK4_AZUFA|nr:scavenger receptor cysteine-rich protein [Azumapecten farreri]